jgi:type VI protein secretion system component VasK
MRARWIIAAVLAVVGVGWIAQGLGAMPGSGLMDGDVRWAAIGAVLLVVGVIVGWTAWRARPRV